MSKNVFPRTAIIGWWELYKRAASIFWPQRRAKASSRGTDKHELGSEEDRVAV